MSVVSSIIIIVRGIVIWGKRFDYPLLGPHTHAPSA